jgi:hypothetical protein
VQEESKVLLAKEPRDRKYDQEVARLKASGLTQAQVRDKINGQDGKFVSKKSVAATFENLRREGGDLADQLNTIPGVYEVSTKKCAQFGFFATILNMELIRFADL